MGDALRRADDGQRVGQQVGVGLLDGHAVISCVLARGAVGKGQDRDVGGHLFPVRIGREAQRARRRRGIAQHGDRHAVGVGIVVDILLPLVGTDDVVDFVAAWPLALDPAGPEVGHFLEHRIAARAQPLAVMRDQVVLPEGPADAAADVLLERSRQRPHRRTFLALAGRLPREHRALVAVAEGILPGRVQPSIAVFQHRARQFWLQGQQRTEHPHVGIPEDVAVIAQAG